MSEVQETLTVEICMNTIEFCKHAIEECKRDVPPDIENQILFNKEIDECKSFLNNITSVKSLIENCGFYEDVMFYYNYGSDRQLIREKSKKQSWYPEQITKDQ